MFNSPWPSDAIWRHRSGLSQCFATFLSLQWDCIYCLADILILNQVLVCLVRHLNEYILPDTHKFPLDAHIRIASHRMRTRKCAHMRTFASRAQKCTQMRAYAHIREHMRAFAWHARLCAHVRAYPSICIACAKMRACASKCAQLSLSEGSGARPLKMLSRDPYVISGFCLPGSALERVHDH